MSLFTEIMNTIGELALASFAPIDMLGNAPNVAIIIVGFALLVMWVGIMRKYTAEAKKNGTIE
ncbi:MAG: hypothetical protein HRT72_07030 [Flavobacteriales bacterium]|nr:hypothetical protein [Flavobacteriales bacterium]